jgi:hypothetical protein
MIGIINKPLLLHPWEKNNNENFKITIPSKNYGRPKTPRKCGIF